MKNLSEFVIGLIFGTGLLVAGMSNPAKVLAFLDLAGNWDPSLALVMAGAVGVSFIAFQLAGRRTSSLYGGALQLPSRRDIDRPLLAGSLLFGIGWGIAGLCPGPALMALGAGEIKAAGFVLAMLLGMQLHRKAQKHL